MSFTTSCHDGPNAYLPPGVELSDATMDSYAAFAQALKQFDQHLEKGGFVPSAEQFLPDIVTDLRSEGLSELAEEGDQVSALEAKFIECRDQDIQTALLSAQGESPYDKGFEANIK